MKQLTPTDRPIKIQKELAALNYKFNTKSDENYFLFCLNEETKSRMNDLCERNSMRLSRDAKGVLTPEPIAPPQNNRRERGRYAYLFLCDVTLSRENV